MLEILATLVIGFSVISAAILLVAYFGFLPAISKTPLSLTACGVLLLALSALQLYHLWFLMTGGSLLASAGYVRLLLVSPVAFFFFSRSLLLPERTLRPVDAAHALPLVIGEFLPAALAVNLAFLVGAGYSLWFAQMVYGMRQHSRRLIHERFFFSVFAVLAVVVLLIGLSVPYLSLHAFHVSYTFAIGMGMILVTGALIAFPELLSDFSDAATATYASSTLGNVDIEGLLAALDRLMTEDKVYRDENLSLTTLAELLGVSGHQLSELINTRHSTGFSRFIREHRIREARQLLENDSTSTVLAIGLATGFQSQSTFYAAFKDVTGMSPGEYRRQRRSSER